MLTSGRSIGVALRFQPQDLEEHSSLPSLGSKLTTRLLPNKALRGLVAEERVRTCATLPHNTKTSKELSIATQ